MKFLIALAVAIVFAFAFRTPLKKYPVVFYAIAIALDVLFAMSAFGTMAPFIRKATFFIIQKCTASLALFVVVMFIGTLPRKSAIRQYLMPVRAELSILACFLAIGHIVVYLSSYVPTVMAGFGVANNTVKAALIVAIVLLVLIIVLGVTSFKFVKKHMSAKQWKAIQRWAYLFYGLVFLHLVLMLLPAALQGGVAARTSIIVYTVIFGLYTVARITRFVIDKRAQEKVDLGDNQFSDTVTE